MEVQQLAGRVAGKPGSTGDPKEQPDPVDGRRGGDDRPDDEAGPNGDVGDLQRGRHACTYSSSAASAAPERSLFARKPARPTVPGPLG